MHGKLYDYFRQDHDRLEALLDQATRSVDAIDREPFDQFRKGILRHIGLEERILLPAVKKANGGISHADAERLRLDHGAIAALLVPPPTPAIVRALRMILGSHNQLEEGPAGIYETGEEIAQPEQERLYEMITSAPEVPVMPYNPSDHALGAAWRAVTRAGYSVQ